MIALEVIGTGRRKVVWCTFSNKQPVQLRYIATELLFLYGDIWVNNYC